MRERQTTDGATVDQAQVIINRFKEIDRKNGINGNTYRVESGPDGQKIVVKEKLNGEEVYQPVNNG